MRSLIDSLNCWANNKFCLAPFDTWESNLLLPVCPVTAPPPPPAGCWFGTDTMSTWDWAPLVDWPSERINGRIDRNLLVWTLDGWSWFDDRWQKTDTDGRHLKIYEPWHQWEITWLYGKRIIWIRSWGIKRIIQENILKPGVSTVNFVSLLNPIKMSQNHSLLPLYKKRIPLKLISSSTLNESIRLSCPD